MIDNTIELGIKARKACCEKMRRATEKFVEALDKELSPALLFCSMTATEAGGSEADYEALCAFFDDLCIKSAVLIEVLTGRAVVIGETIALSDLCRDLIGADATAETAIERLEATDGWCGVHASAS